MQMRRSRGEWQKLSDEYEASCETMESYCASRGLNAKYFSCKRIKLKKSGQPVSGPERFIELSSVGMPTRAVFVVEHGALKIHVNDAGMLKEALTALRGERC